MMKGKMKKLSLAIGIIVVVVVLAIGFGTGGKRGDVMLMDYAISQDKHTMKLKVAVASSMGYVNRLKVKQGGDNLYLTFYSTIGLNNSIGAKSTFEMSINDFCEEIYFYHGDGGYRLVLTKSRETNEWQRADTNT